MKKVLSSISTRALFLWLSFLCLNLSGAPVSAVGVSLEGEMEIKSKGKMGEIRGSYPFLFTIRVKGNEYSIHPRPNVEQYKNSNNLAQSIWGLSENNRWQMELADGKPKAAMLWLGDNFPPTRETIPRILRWAYLGPLTKTMDKTEEYYSLPAEEGKYDSNELKYKVSEQGNAQESPESVDCVGPSYFYLTEKAKKLGQKSAMVDQFNNGRILWRYRVLGWTNFQSTKIPIRFSFDRYTEYTSANIIYVSNVVSSIEGSLKHARVDLQERAMLPKINGEMPVFDFRFRDQTGNEEPVRYQTTNEFIKSTQDPQVMKAVKEQEEHVLSSRRHLLRPRHNGLPSF
jgi:hypothetical protein